MDEDEAIEHEYQGQTWKLPRHLAQLQVAIAKADLDCRREYENPEDLQTVRAKRLDLVVEKYRLARPWWDRFEKHDRWHADWALQDYGRAQAAPAPAQAATVTSRRLITAIRRARVRRDKRSSPVGHSGPSVRR